MVKFSFVIKLVMLCVCLGGSSVFADDALKDPTKPYTYIPVQPKTVVAATPIRVSFIKQSVDGNVAYINGVPVREGETIEGMRVTKITQRGVRLNRGGRSKWVALHDSEGIIKKQ